MCVCCVLFIASQSQCLCVSLLVEYNLYSFLCVQSPLRLYVCALPPHITTSLPYPRVLLHNRLNPVEDGVLPGKALLLSDARHSLSTTACLCIPIITMATTGCFFLSQPQLCAGLFLYSLLIPIHRLRECPNV